MTSTRTMGRDGTTLRILGWDGSSLGVGQFAGAPPLAFKGGDANLYRYVHDDPTDRVDPSGLEEEPPITFPPSNISPPASSRPSGPPGGFYIPNPGQVITPSGGMMRNPSSFPEVTGACNALKDLSSKDGRERGTGVYMNDDGDIMVGVPTRGGIRPGNRIGSHNRIDLNPLGNCPKGWKLIATIHSHPPDPDPASKSPQNSPLDPDNSNNPVGNSPPVPWFVIDSDGKIYLIGPDIRGGARNPIAR